MRAASATIVALLTGLLVGGCAGSQSPPRPPGAGQPPADAGRSPAPAVTTAGSVGFNPTDIAWIQLMRPMTEQTLRLLELVPEHTANPGVTALAGRAGEQGRADVAQLDELLRRSAAPTGNPHEGHLMPGLLTADELAGIARTTGAAFDQRFTDSFRKYAEQCGRLAHSEQQYGSDPATTRLAAAIEKAATAQVDQLQRLKP
jgi:uncharacterized protein (DUF305 family)